MRCVADISYYIGVTLSLSFATHTIRVAMIELYKWWRWTRMTKICIVPKTEKRQTWQSNHKKTQKRLIPPKNLNDMSWNSFPLHSPSFVSVNIVQQVRNFMVFGYVNRSLIFRCRESCAHTACFVEFSSFLRPSSFFIIVLGSFCC